MVNEEMKINKDENEKLLASYSAHGRLLPRTFFMTGATIKL